MTKALTLFELNQLVRETIELSMPDEYWVEAELSEVREVRGHCYIQLIQKDDRSNTPIAQASARCWKSTWMDVKPLFEKTTGQQMHAGLKVLFKVYPQFHENYGFSWIVTDIDPTYTIGDMMRKRQEIIRTLKEEGVFDLQKSLSLPMFCQHIAVISSQNAAGYGDFVNQLSNNEYHFRFQTQLFPAIMQGEQVEESIIHALNKIYAIHQQRLSDDTSETPFDCVVIIRGGGATADLSGFDTLALAENVANFPLPIITGIGHERDESILDMVSHTRVKTPTAAAAFLISQLKVVYDELNGMRQDIINAISLRMEREQLRINRLSNKMTMLFSMVKSRQENILQQHIHRIKSALDRFTIMERNKLDKVEKLLIPYAEKRIMSEQHRLQLLQQRVEAANPEHLLRKGYSITLHNGKMVRDIKQVKSGDRLETRLSSGTIHSIVE
ncbi:MAG: exodeoxyribonuclease VII large subunit [Prevotella sp.]|nr:exodeoxyribonuclease VII large subunit [Prevotella sp.]